MTVTLTGVICLHNIVVPSHKTKKYNCPVHRSLFLRRRLLFLIGILSLFGVRFCVLRALEVLYAFYW